MTALVNSCAPWLTNRARSVHSQFGEDGLIEAALERIGTKNEWCFEVGAGNGEEISNTLILRERGWRAVLIEADDALCEQARRFADDKVAVVCARIDGHNLEDVLSFNGVPRDLDFASIDIDGQDFWLWDSMVRYRPRLMLIEFSPYVEDPDFIPQPGEDGQGGKRQAGLAAMRKLADYKGYVELARTYCNLLFVAQEAM